MARRLIFVAVSRLIEASSGMTEDGSVRTARLITTRGLSKRQSRLILLPVLKE